MCRPLLSVGRPDNSGRQESRTSVVEATAGRHVRRVLDALGPARLITGVRRKNARLGEHEHFQQ